MLLVRSNAIEQLHVRILSLSRSKRKASKEDGELTKTEGGRFSTISANVTVYTYVFFYCTVCRYTCTLFSIFYAGAKKFFPRSKVPNSDLFEIGSVDEIYGKSISSMLDPGCFLAVIRRKEMMQFDSLFMIKVAESKGLFGGTAVRGEPKLESVQDRSLRPPSQNSARKRASRASKVSPLRNSVCPMPFRRTIDRREC